ncbi:hypothetical protein [Pararhizobium sp. PWRC1-1]|uniref:hypothetical protein n=1 Tax=Pararhizobium sp. PWRC1-1 TaxID=2804566 RepID=UPI003CF93C81
MCTTFVLRQLRVPEAIIDVALLGRTQFRLLLAQYLQLLLGKSPLEAASGRWFRVPDSSPVRCSHRRLPVGFQ